MCEYIISLSNGNYAVMKSVIEGEDKFIVECESYDAARDYIDDTDNELY